VVVVVGGTVVVVGGTVVVVGGGPVGQPAGTGWLLVPAATVTVLATAPEASSASTAEPSSVVWPVTASTASPSTGAMASSSPASSRTELVPEGTLTITQSTGDPSAWPKVPLASTVKPPLPPEGMSAAPVPTAAAFESSTTTDWIEQPFGVPAFTLLVPPEVTVVLVVPVVSVVPPAAVPAAAPGTEQPEAQRAGIGRGVAQSALSGHGVGTGPQTMAVPGAVLPPAGVFGARQGMGTDVEAA